MISLTSTTYQLNDRPQHGRYWTIFIWCPAAFRAKSLGYSRYAALSFTASALFPIFKYLYFFHSILINYLQLSAAALLWPQPLLWDATTVQLTCFCDAHENWSMAIVLLTWRLSTILDLSRDPRSHTETLAIVYRTRNRNSAEKTEVIDYRFIYVIASTCQVYSVHGVLGKGEGSPKSWRSWGWWRWWTLFTD